MSLFKRKYETEKILLIIRKFSLILTRENIIIYCCKISFVKYINSSEICQILDRTQILKIKKI